jgi:glutamate synthase domain-containing protein 3
MTNGLVIVLGTCGRNFAAGMSGGIAYVFDERGNFAEERCNLGSVDLESIDDLKDAQIIQGLVARHLELTGSRRAKWILQNWAEMLPRFIKVFPHEYKRVLGVSRSRRLQVLGQPMPPVAHVEHARHARVQNGQVQHG